MVIIYEHRKAPDSSFHSNPNAVSMVRAQKSTQIWRIEKSKEEDENKNGRKKIGLEVSMALTRLVTFSGLLYPQCLNACVWAAHSIRFISLIYVLHILF